ncbi:hypothetical protein M8J76_002949 [Diaphorina citri]|nr:hypothetical protein M8J76_002949 [Diaphorina citri]
MNSEQCELFSLTELGEVISHMKLKKAPGPDSIPAEIVKEIYLEFPQMVLKVMNRCLRHGEFPAEWKSTKLVLIPKPGASPDGSVKYRPICLLDCFGKVLEGLIAQRLNDSLDTNNGISEYQFGFRRQCSTVEAIGRVVSIAREEMVKTPYRRDTGKDIAQMVHFSADGGDILQRGTEGTRVIIADDSYTTDADDLGRNKIN